METGPEPQEKVSRKTDWIPEEPKPIAQADQAKFMVYFTVGLFGFIIFMAIVLQFATHDR